ncbi:MAG: thiamine pyrophosphate-dependent enzyme [Candidatus Levyibacteriota bacterium]
MTLLADLQTPCSPTWCPGCGDFAIWSALKNAAVEKGWDSTNTAIFTGIGCHGHITNFTKITSMNCLHGRSIPVATGLKITNKKLHAFVFTGDGDGLAEGGNHLVHAARRNHDITVVLHDNAIYALTTGQTSPRSPHGFKSKSTPEGNLDNPLSPLTLAIASGATFVAREYAAHIPQLTQLMIKANEHKGFSLIDVLQPCVSFNEMYNHAFYQENTYYLPEDYDKTDKKKAFEKSLEWGEKQIPLGILYEVDTPSYEDQITEISEKTLFEKGTEKRDITETLKKYT